jgi:hypothetical protein
MIAYVLKSTAASATLLVLIGGAYAQQAETYLPPVPYYRADKPYVDRALEFMSGNGKRSRRELERWYYPVVVHLPQMVCVGLNLVRGVGETRTFCFNQDGGQLILDFSS